MDCYAGHADGVRTVHLTTRSFFIEALCGDEVVFDGEPDLAVICDDCHALALQAGGEPSSWMVEIAVLEVRAAA